MHAVRLPLTTRIEIPPPPAPRLTIDAPVVEYDQPPVILQGLTLDPAANAGGMPGLDTGLLGPGEGEGSGAGLGGDYRSPIPRSIVPHWDPPEAVRGMEVTVRVFVDEWGSPTGEVELDPPTPHRGFNREIVERVRRMEYRPARRNGSPVAGWAVITFVF
jgi:TonB family protein